MKDVDAAWLAGYIDGDGCITLSSSVKKVSPVLHIDSCDREMLDDVVRLCGGHIVNKTKSKDHHRQAYTWRLKGTQKIQGILRYVRPFMRCRFKVMRADIVLNEWSACTAIGGAYTDEIRVARVAMIARFMQHGDGRGKRNIKEG